MVRCALQPDESGLAQSWKARGHSVGMIVGVIPCVMRMAGTRRWCLIFMAVPLCTFNFPRIAML